MKGRRREALIFTATGKRDAAAVIADCERSLTRFQTDVIDGYFVHGGWSDGFVRRPRSFNFKARSASSVPAATFRATP